MNRIRFWIEVEADIEQGGDIKQLAEQHAAALVYYTRRFESHDLQARPKRDIMGRVIAESVDTNPAD